MLAAAPRTAADLVALISHYDEVLGQQLYNSARPSKRLTLVATLITFSGDEAFWMALPIVVAFLHHLVGLGHPGVEVDRCCVELFGDVMMVCVIEMGLKSSVQRGRPRYAPQSNFYILPGEWWSLPSGHALRASFLVHRLFGDPDLAEALVGGFASSCWLLMLAASWAVLVGWSRVAKGRHSPCDVLTGLVAGVLVAKVALATSLWAWSIAKLFAGSLECFFLGFMTARPELRLEGYIAHASLQALWFAAQPYGLGVRVSWSAVFGLSTTLFLSSYAVGICSRKVHKQ